VTSRDPLDEIAREMHDQALRSARFSFAHRNGDWSVLDASIPRRERPDWMRVRMAKLEERQTKMETALKVCLAAGVAMGLGALAYQNRASLQDAWNGLPTMAALQTRAWARWNQFRALFN